MTIELDRVYRVLSVYRADLLNPATGSTIAYRVAAANATEALDVVLDTKLSVLELVGLVREFEDVRMLA